MKFSVKYKIDSRQFALGRNKRGFIQRCKREAALNLAETILEKLDIFSIYESFDPEQFVLSGHLHVFTEDEIIRNGNIPKVMMLPGSHVSCSQDDPSDTMPVLHRKAQERVVITMKKTNETGQVKREVNMEE